MKRTLPAEAVREVGMRLEQAHKAFQRRYPGASGERQPVHVVYGGAHLFRAGTPSDLANSRCDPSTNMHPTLRPSPKRLAAGSDRLPSERDG